jgi:hypothetical protein
LPRCRAVPACHPCCRHMVPRTVSCHSPVLVLVTGALGKGDSKSDPASYHLSHQGPNLNLPFALLTAFRCWLSLRGLYHLSKLQGRLQSETRSLPVREQLSLQPRVRVALFVSAPRSRLSGPGSIASEHLLLRQTSTRWRLSHLPALLSVSVCSLSILSVA